MSILSFLVTLIYYLSRSGVMSTSIQLNKDPPSSLAFRRREDSKVETIEKIMVFW
jgi:hypothetical protein